ncbi:hypothetical protein, conserved [Eimeria praecox]|uniref:Myosin heavy chain n=1 Tax=Eimeria praecox TaxID=51316 RepID=U6H1U3_9EIME|nr:hypothetical protein, conserved [Eimeria praecox]
MKYVGVWRSLLLLSSTKVCLEWAGASQFPGAYQQWETNAELNTEPWGVATDSVGENDSIQQRTVNASLVADEDLLALPAVEIAAPSVEVPADVGKPGGGKPTVKNVALGVSLMLLMCLGLFAVARKEKVPTPAPPKEEELPVAKPKLTTHEQLRIRVERARAVSRIAERIASAIDDPEAAALQAQIKRNLDDAKNAKDDSTVEGNLRAANELINEMDMLAREYCALLVDKYSTSPPIPDLLIKLDGQEVPFLEIVDGFHGNNVVKNVANSLISLQKTSEKAKTFVVQLGEEIASAPAYSDERDRLQLEKEASRLEYLKSLVASRSREVSVGTKLKKEAVEGLHALMCRDGKESVLLLENDVDLLEISIKVMQKRDPPPGVEPADYQNACAALGVRLKDLQGTEHELHAHLEELQRSRALQPMCQADSELVKTIKKAKADLTNVWKTAAAVDRGFDRIGEESKNLIPTKVLNGHETVASEVGYIDNSMKTLEGQIKKLAEGREPVSDEDVPGLSTTITNDIVSRSKGIMAVAEGIRHRSRGRMHLNFQQVGPQDVASIVEEYKGQMVSLARTRKGADMLHVEAGYFVALEEELKRQLEEAEEVAAFMFPDDNSRCQKLARLKRRFDETTQSIGRAKNVADAADTLSLSGGLLDSMHELVREALKSH